VEEFRFNERNHSEMGNWYNKKMFLPQTHADERRQQPLAKDFQLYKLTQPVLARVRQ
jgi:hypothetical protein